MSTNPLKDGKLAGLKYAVSICEMRKSGSRKTRDHIAALDDVKVFLEAAIERTENGEEMGSTATTQNETRQAT